MSVHMVLLYWENPRQLGIIKVFPDNLPHPFVTRQDNDSKTSKDNFKTFIATVTQLFYQAKDNGTNKLCKPIPDGQNIFFNGQG